MEHHRLIAVTQVMDADGRCIVYERRRPESSVFYRIVAEHSQTLIARAEEDGPGYPTHVKREVERFLSGGILAHLGLPSEMPTIAPARAPPQQELDFVDLDEMASEAPEGL